jgi:hypothetical protein
MYRVPSSRATALDFQRYIFPDVLVADQQTNTVTVQTPAAGGQSFAPIQTLADDPNSHLAPGAVQWAKMEGNAGLFDAVVVASGSNSVMVYHTAAIDPATGNPTIAPPTAYAVGTDPVAVTIQDINGDGIPDMLIANKNSNDISILFGSIVNGIWTGTPGPRLRSDGTGPIGITLQDVNGDKIPDLVVTNSGSNSVTVLPGIGSNGVGTGFFQDNNPIALSVPGTPIGPITDGLLPTTQGIFKIDLNAGLATQVFASTDLTAISVGADGDVAAGFGDGTVQLLTPAANGALAEALIFRDAGLTDPSGLEIFNNNGQSEIYATSAGENRVFVFALSDGIPVPNSNSQPDSLGPSIDVQSLTAAGIFLIPSFVTGASTESQIGLAGDGAEQAANTAVVAYIGENGSVGSENPLNESLPTAFSADSASPRNGFIIGVDDGVRSIREQIREQRVNRAADGSGAERPMTPVPDPVEPKSDPGPSSYMPPEKGPWSGAPGAPVVNEPAASARQITGVWNDGHQTAIAVAPPREQLSDVNGLAHGLVGRPVPSFEISPDALNCWDVPIATDPQPPDLEANASTAVAIDKSPESQSSHEPLLVALFLAGTWQWSAKERMRRGDLPPVPKRGAGS